MRSISVIRDLIILSLHAQFLSLLNAAVVVLNVHARAGKGFGTS